MEQNQSEPQQKNEDPQPKQEPVKQEAKKPTENSSCCCQRREKNGFNFGRFFLGFIVLIIGLIFLAQTTGWTDLSGFNINWPGLWPLIIIIIGLSMLSLRGWIGAILGILITLIVLAIAAFLIFGSPATINSVSGNIITEKIAIEGVNKIALSGTGNLIIQQSTSTESLTIEAQDNIMPRIKTSINGQTLSIKYEWDWFWFSLTHKKPVNFYVTIKDVNAISISGAATVQGSEIKTNDLKIKISGAGKVDSAAQTNNIESEVSGTGKFSLTGKTNSQKIEISGAGKYDAQNLESKTAQVKISGAGNATIKVSDSLDAQISGAGQISYIGNPQVTQNISGAGSIKKLHQ